jgi:tetratricopeptide (TPR) repeat protein
MRYRKALFLALVALASFVACAEEDLSPLVQRRWFEARTAHFNIYSCGETQQVSRLAGHLEQFRLAYLSLAGVQAVASPPIVVLAFPDSASMQPFLPIRGGKPASLTAFFHRGSDENLIVLPLTESVSLQAILHEYTHLLLRHNDSYWPLWLKEGMAEIYGTLEVIGGHNIRIGKPIPEHLSLLGMAPMLPLHDLFRVSHDSPEYNERDRQGMFYAQSWLLAHYLMIGDQAAHRPAFGQFSVLLRQGQPPEQAFTTVFNAPGQVIEKELRSYAKRPKLESLDLSVTADLTMAQPIAIRPLGSVEVCFRLGDELFRVGRSDAARIYFLHGEKLAPRSPLPSEGLGLIAADRNATEEAIRLLGQALQRGSISFLAHYIYAAQKFKLASQSADYFVAVKGEAANEIRTELKKSLSLMPDFGGAHHLLGIFELVQGENAAEAEKHLQRAIQLEPENLSYLLSLAQSQMLKDDVTAARRTLESLRRPYVNPKLRLHATEMLQEMDRHSEKQGAKR